MKNKKEKKNNIPRREFIKGAAISSLGLIILPRHTMGGKRYIPPSDKVNIGIIGAGGQSMYSIRELLKLEDVQLTAIADPAYYWKNDILYNSDSGRGPTKKFIEAYYAKKTHT